MPVDQYATQRSAAGDAAAICWAVLHDRDYPVARPDEFFLNESAVTRLWLWLDERRVVQHELGEAAFVFASVLLSVIAGRVNFDSADELLDWLRAIAEPRNGA
jgi:hypothetical protein